MPHIASRPRGRAIHDQIKQGTGVLGPVMTKHYQACIQLHMAVRAVAFGQALILWPSSTCTQLKLAICMPAGRLQAAEGRGMLRHQHHILLPHETLHTLEQGRRVPCVPQILKLAGQRQSRGSREQGGRLAGSGQQHPAVISFQLMSAWTKLEAGWAQAEPRQQRAGRRACARSCSSRPLWCRRWRMTSWHPSTALRGPRT